jgi:DNA modification methylase
VTQRFQINDPIIECAKTLTQIHKTGKQNPRCQWDMFITYNNLYETIRKYINDKTGKYPSRQTIIRHIRAVPNYNGPSGNWLRQARKVAETFPEIVSFENGDYPQIPYSHYLKIADCNAHDKRSFIKWAIKTKASKSEISERIRILVKDEARPDFELKTTNVWRFSKRNKPNSFEGGIYPDIIANLIHYFTDAGDTVIDPMAGAGTTHYVVKSYSYFQQRNPALEHSGPREVLLADIAPHHEFIIQNDAIRDLPWDNNIAQLAILDPPYYGIANGKYPDIGRDINTWRTNLRSIIRNCIRCVRQNGYIAVIVDDYNRIDEHHPLSVYTMLDAIELGLEPARTLYNLSANFIYTMNGAMMNNAKSARLPVNDMKIIHVFKVLDN